MLKERIFIILSFTLYLLLLNSTKKINYNLSLNDIFKQDDFLLKIKFILENKSSQDLFKEYKINKEDLLMIYYYKLSFNKCLKFCHVDLNFIEKMVFRCKNRKLIEDCHYKSLINNILNNDLINDSSHFKTPSMFYLLLKNYKNVNFYEKILHSTNFKVNGRFAFFRVLSFTEFFSSFFSILGLIVILSLKPKNKNQKNFVKFCSLSLVSSCLFHWYDSYITEKLDYISALLLIYYITHSNVKIIFYNKKNVYLGLLRSILLVFSVYSLFSFNAVIFKCVIGLIISIFIASSLFLSRIVLIRYILVNSIMACLIEGLDRPPIFYLLDSHATWHLVNIFNMIMYYEFLDTVYN